MLAAAYAAFALASAPAVEQDDSSTYASARVRRVVDSAAVLNLRVPRALGRYTASLESEISAGLSRGEGTEATVGLEQIASTLTWDRRGNTEQRVMGYRSQSVGPTFSSLGYFEYAWAVPTLYGNRLALMFGSNIAASSNRPDTKRRRSTEHAVHPLASDRVKYYRYAGGDTVVTMVIGTRTIPIVRILVTPRPGLSERVILFDGEVDLDAKRWHVVRMRGRFGISGGSPTFREAVQSRAVEGIAYVELVNLEVNGEYWVPQYQRFEAQVRAPLAGDAKVVYRIFTRFRDVVASPLAVGDGQSPADSLEPRPHVLAIAGPDQLTSYRGWNGDIGTLTSDLRARDFDDLAPGSLRPTGKPVLLVQAERLSDLARFNRVEGLFTGLGLTARLRDRVPGLVVRATGGWAWSERTARGRLSADYVRGHAEFGLLAGRTLDLTNDFRSPFDSGSSVGALFGQDDYDYVDRRLALGAFTYTAGRAGASVRLESGLVEDRGVQTHLSYGPVFRTDAFLPNRGVRNGTYARHALELRYNADLDAQLLRVGRSAVLRYERGDGTLNYQRIELRLMQRANRGDWTFASRFDAGAVLGGDPPPQQLFELGRSENLAAYRYKEFAGDQAAALRGLATYKLPWFRVPVHVAGRFWLPEPSPALAVVLQGGWTGASGAAAWRSISELGQVNGVPVSRPTGSARASFGAGLRFFGGAMGVMIQRPIDHGDAWRVHVDFTPQP